MYQVLLIDDNRAEMATFMDIMKQMKGGVKCAYAANGKVALDLLHHMSPNFIFIHFNDEALKTLSAIRFERRLRSIKVYLYAERISEEMNKMAKILGASGCMEKDPDMNGLIHKFRAIFSPELLPAYAFLKYNCPEPVYGDGRPDTNSLLESAAGDQ